jgi:flagellum-specific ATP synthase
VDGDDFNDPIADTVRSILDGHVTLSRRLATRNQYPAFDVLESVSRLMIDVCSAEEVAAAGEARKLMAVYRDVEDIINIGAYVKGANAEIDRAISRFGDLNALFKQGVNEINNYAESVTKLKQIVEPPRK